MRFREFGILHVFFEMPMNKSSPRIAGGICRCGPLFLLLSTTAAPLLEAAAFEYPLGIAAAEDGTLYVADRNSGMLRKITSDGIIHDVAIAPIVTLAVDKADILFMGIAAGGQFPSSSLSLLPVDVAPVIENPPLFARTPFGILALSESLLSMAFDSANNLYVADPENSRVLQISPDGVMRNFASSWVITRWTRVPLTKLFT